MPAAHRQSDQPEKDDADDAAADDLHGAGADDHHTGADDLLQIDFKPDHEQQKDQAKLRDRGDGFLGADPTQARRAEQETGDEIGENDRQARVMRRDADEPSCENCERNVVNELVHAGFL